MSKAALGWGHININVSNLDRSVAFYELLGFRRFMPGIPYLQLEEARAGAMHEDSAAALGLPAGVRGRACIMGLDDGFPKLDLTELAVGAQASPLANADLGVVRICLSSRDLPGDYERLTAAGVEFLSAPAPAASGLADLAVCRDPDGTLIEVVQIYLDRWARLADDG
ncbi:MAG: VOC family protein [Pseudomonadota bacterium]